MSQKTRRSSPDHHPQSPFFPKKDKNYKSITRKTRNPVTPDKPCHSCLKKFFSKNCPTSRSRSPIPNPRFPPKKDKNYKSRTRKTRNLVTPDKPCLSCLKIFFSKIVPRPHHNPQSPFSPKKTRATGAEQEKQEIL